MELDRSAVAAIGTTLVLWASAFVAIRFALPGIGVAALSLGRLLVAAVALAVVAVFSHVRRPQKSDLARIAGCGLAGMTVYQLLLNTGERTVPAGTASLLVATAPIFAALLAVALLREALGTRRRIGIALGFVGADAMALGQGGGLRLSPDALLLLGGAFSQAVFFVLQKPLLARYTSLEVTCYAMWAGALFSLPLLPWLASGIGHAHASSLVALLFLGLGPSAIGFVTWAYGQARLPVASLANTLYLVPLIAIVLGWWTLGETVHPLALLGGGLALAGVVLGRARTARPSTLEVATNQAGSGQTWQAVPLSAAVARPINLCEDLPDHAS